MVTFLDVRGHGEIQDGHVDGALPIPLHELLGRTDRVPAERPVDAHCAGSCRATTAASILHVADNDVTAVIGSSDETDDAGLPVSSAGP